MHTLTTCDAGDTKYDKYVLSMYKTYLDADEFERYFNFKNPLQKKVFLVARGELKSKIAAFLECEPFDVHLSYNQFGKPFLENSNIHFSLSHTGNLIALIFSDKHVGIDMEMNIPRNFSKISKRVFNKEITDTDEFYKTWTLNEAITKCNGSTLLLQARRNNELDYDIFHTSYKNAIITVATRK